MKKTAFSILLAFLLIASLLVMSVPAVAASVVPSFVPGNPTCADLGYDYCVKVDPVQSGTQTITVAGGTITLTVDAKARYFDWVSTFGISAVIVKGGPCANVYEYAPSSYGDTDLHAPFGAGKGGSKPYGLSHIIFCYGDEPPPPDPSIDIVKYLSVNYDPWIEANDYYEVVENDQIRFKIVITNTGDVELTNIQIEDFFANEDSPYDQTPISVTQIILTGPGSLAPGASYEIIYGPFTAGYCYHTNTVTVFGTYDGSVYSAIDVARYKGRAG